MALAYDTFSNLASGTDTRSWSHGGSASAKGAIVVVLGGAVDSTSGVTYGGTAMTRAQTGVNAGGESGTTSVWFLGESLPTGTQTVQVTRNTAVDAYIATCFTVTAANDTEYITGDNGNSTTISTIATSLTIPSGKQVFMAGGLYSGENALSSITDNADLTRAHSADFGNFVGVINRKTTLYTGTGAAYTNFAWTQSSDDGAWAAIAIAEQAGNFSRTSTRSGTGSITATGVVARASSASLAGAGAITATGVVNRATSASLAGSGTLTATGLVPVNYNRTSSLSSTGSITATGVIGTFSDSALTGTVLITSTGVVSGETGVHVNIVNAWLDDLDGCWIQLHTADPGADGTANVSAGTSTRVQASTNGAASGIKTLSANTGVWVNSGATESITHITLWPGPSSGPCQMSIQLDSPVSWDDTNTILLDAMSMGLSAVGA